MRRFDLIWHHDGSVYADLTASLGDGSAAFTLPAGETLYLAQRDWLSGVYVNLAVAPSSPGITPEMYDAATGVWRTLPAKEEYVQLSLGHTLDPTGYDFTSDGALYWGSPQWVWALRKAVTGSFPESVGTVPDESALYYWVRLRNTGAQDVSFQRLLPLLYNTYITHQDVASFLGIPEFDNVRDPLQDEIRRRIHSVEDWIDNHTRRSWRIRPFFNEGHDFNPYGIRLRRQPVITVSAVRIWNGGSFESFTEGRAQQWYLEAPSGFLRFTLPTYRLRQYSWWLTRHVRQNESLRVDYVAGDDYDLADDRGVVEQIALMKVGAYIATQQDWVAALVTNSDNVTKPEKVKMWNDTALEDADKLRGPALA